jgi:hypothetical protein
MTMKNRLVVLGTVALAVGGVLILTRLFGGKEHILRPDEDESARKDSAEYPSAFAETEFQGLDFLA